MTGTSIGGQKANNTIRNKYGVEKIREWGSIGNKKRKKRSGGFCDPELRARASVKGGHNSQRSRVITKNTPLRFDEWCLLMNVVRNTLIELTARDATFSSEEADKATVKALDYMRAGDWQTVMSNLIEYPHWTENLNHNIVRAHTETKKEAKDTPRRSLKREEARVYKNLKAAISLI